MPSTTSQPRTGELLGKAGKLARSSGDTYHTPNHPFASSSGNAALSEGESTRPRDLPQNGAEQNPEYVADECAWFGFNQAKFSSISQRRPLPESSADIGMQPLCRDSTVIL